MGIGTILGLFTGSSKYIYIALVILSILCFGLSALSISLYGDKRELAIQIDTVNDSLKKSNKEHKEVVETLESKLSKLEDERDELSNNLAKVEALSEKLKAEAQHNAEVGAKKQKELEKQYVDRLKRFNERVKNVQDYGDSDSSIVDAAGI